ncbi:MAG: sulfotransferase domain-containing protein [Planctomycetota bacterium]
MRLPDFLIIGAMKAGTTSLFRDLDANPAVFMPHQKELGNLANDEVCTDRGRSAYAAFFERARPDQIRGEASTEYTKLPDVPQVAKRAREVIGGGLKALYLIREPVSRIVSQHHHELPGGKISCDIDEAVRELPRLINYSRYAMQITPWLEALGPEQILILRFETYIENRRDSVDEVCGFLGIDASSDPLRTNIVYNKSENKPLTRGPLAPLVRSAVYRKLIRPHLPHSTRDGLRKALLPKALPRPKPPSVETVRYIIDQLRDDGERLRTIMGRPEPLWDPDEVLRRFQEVRGEA